MKNLNKTFFVWLLVGASAIIWVVLAWLYSVSSADVVGLFKLLPTVVAIDCVLIWVFVKWGWRWPLLHPWLVPFPDLNGKWKGEIHSTYRDRETGENVPIATTLTIRQTFIEISCIMETNEMKSASGLADFFLDSAQQQKQLIYTYCSRPKLTLADKSQMHDRTVTFDIVGNPPSRLVGRYWTTRRTVGDIELSRLKRIGRSSRPK
jgi:predicted pore-forming effector associated with SMODS systems